MSIDFSHDPARPTGRLFVVSGPSGVGKDTVLDCLFQQVPGLTRSVSATTRPPREYEIDGVDYFFISPAEFERRIGDGCFLEYAGYGENYYGTPVAGVAELRGRGLDVVLKIEVQGALQVRKIVADAVLVFIQPPSPEELERRLRARATDTEEKIDSRLERARAEMACIPRYDYLITNDDLNSAVDSLRAVILAERCRIRP